MCGFADLGLDLTSVHILLGIDFEEATLLDSDEVNCGSQQPSEQKGGSV